MPAFPEETPEVPAEASASPEVPEIPSAEAVEAPADVSAAETEVPAPTQKKKFPVWLAIVLPVVVIAAVVVLTVLLWPKKPAVVLANASLKTSEALAARYAGSPLVPLAKAIRSMESGRTDITMTTTMDFSAYGMRFQSVTDIGMQFDGTNRRMAFSVTEDEEGESFRVDAYLDRDCLAFSSDMLPQEGYYGIHFDTLEEDVKKYIPGGEDMLNPESLDMLDRFRALFDTNRPDASLLLPYRDIFARYAAEVEPKLEDGFLIIDDQALECTTVTMDTTSETVLAMLLEVIAQAKTDEALKDYFDTQAIFLDTSETSWEEKLGEAEASIREFQESGKGFRITYTYFIYNDYLAQMKAAILPTEDGQAVDEDQLLMELTFGTDPETSDLRFSLTIQEDGVDNYALTVTASGSADGSTRTDELVLFYLEPGSNSTATIRTQWDAQTGALNISTTATDEDPASFDAVLLDEGETVRFTADWEPDTSVSGTATVTTRVSFSLVTGAGEPLEVPAYRGMDQWDEEFLQMLFPGYGDPYFPGGI